MKLYLGVTPDEYELPMIVCDTPAELSLKTGISVGTILSNISHKSSGKKNGMKIIRIVVDD